MIDRRRWPRPTWPRRGEIHASAAVGAAMHPWCRALTAIARVDDPAGLPVSEHCRLFRTCRSVPPLATCVWISRSPIKIYWVSLTLDLKADARGRQLLVERNRPVAAVAQARRPAPAAPPAGLSPCVPSPSCRRRRHRPELLVVVEGQDLAVDEDLRAFLRVGSWRPSPCRSACRPSHRA